MEERLFQSHVVGKDGFFWWIGQIAKRETWENNKPGVPVANNEDSEYKGFGERYRVRIQGYHPSIGDDVFTDDQLPFAYIMYPTTAGGGGRSSGQSANMVEGTMVFGFFLDGEQAQIPVIIGCVGYNDYQAVALNAPEETRQTPHSAFGSEHENNEVPPYAVKEDGAGVVEQQENQQGEPINDTIITSVEGSSAQREMSAKEQEEEGKVQEAIAVTEDCEPLPTNRIQTNLMNVMTEMEKVQKSVYDARKSISMGSADIQEKLNGLNAKAAELMAGQMKQIFTQIEKSVLEMLNSSVKPVHDVLHPNERPELKEAMDEANDLIACLFKNLMSKLYDLCYDMIRDLTGADGSGQKIINFSDCYVDSMVGSLIGNVLSDIESIMNDVLKVVNDILSSIGVAASAAGGLGGLLGAVGSVGGMGGSLSILEDAFSYLNCEEQTECPTTDTWSLWYGAQSSEKGDMSGIMSAAESQMNNKSNQDSLNIGFDDLDYDDIGQNSDCSGSENDSTGPQTCKPPKAKFRDGYGVEGNVIVTQNGKVIAVDITRYGVNYSEFDSSIKIKDNCGIGHGAVAEPVIDEVVVCYGGNDTLTITYGDIETTLPGAIMNDGNLGYYDKNDKLQPIFDREGDPIQDCGRATSIVDVIIISPGLDYLPSPDGSEGGFDRVWKEPDETVIQNPDGTYQPPIPPGFTVPVPPGGSVITPPTSPPVIPVPNPGTGGGTGPERPTTPGTTPGTGTGGGGGTGPERPEEPPTIFPGIPTVIPELSTITTPYPVIENITGGYPSTQDGGYPVILYLCEVIVTRSGMNYRQDDEIVIRPDNGATAVPKFDQQGRLISVKVTSGGEGFTEIPYIYVKSSRGFNAKLTPKFCIDRISNETAAEPDYQDKVVSVIDCVGNTQVGYLKGKPYYGPYHEHNGVKMVGYVHTDKSHDVITDTP